MGRERELEELRRGLDAAREGRGSAFQLVGEPGIGKSTLLRSFAQLATADGGTVVWGRCWEGGGAPAYWPWTQVIRSLLASVDRQPASPLVGPAAVLAEMVPELRATIDTGVDGALEAQPEQARFALFAAVSDLVRSAAGTDILVVAVEDLHAADVASVVLMRFLARDLQEAPVVLVGTYRDVGARAAPATAAALGELGGEGRRLDLRGLGRDEVALVVEAATGASPPKAAVARLHRASGGNPFFLEQLVREGSMQGPARPGLSHRVPDTCRDAIRRRLGLLSPECARLLQQAAVVGGAPTLAVLQVVTEVDVDTVLDLLAEAVRAGLLVEEQAHYRYSFVHALVRETLYDELAPSERLRLHARVGKALERLYGSDPEPHLAELAYHFATAAPVVDINKAIDFATKAGERALGQLAYEEAAAQFARALALAEAATPDKGYRLCELLLALGDAQWRAGELPAAHASFTQAAALARSLGSPERLARAALGRAVGENMTHPDPPLVSLLREALEALGAEDSALRARVLSRLVVAVHPYPGSAATGDTVMSASHTQALSDEAVAVARRVEDPATLARALTARLHTRWDAADADELLATAAEMLWLAQPARDTEMELQAHMWRVIALLERGDVPGSAAALDAYHALARRLGQPLWLFYAASRRAALALLTGHFEEAEELVDEAVAQAARSQADEAALVAATQRHQLHWELGLRDKLEPALPAVRAWAASVPVARFATPAVRLAWLLWATGHEAEARYELERFASRPLDELPTGAPDILFAIAMVADLVAEIPGCKVPEDALARLYRRLQRHAGRVVVVGGAVLSWGFADRPLGLLAAALGRLDEANSHLDAALDGHRRLGALPWLARTERDFARLLLRGGQPEGRRRAGELVQEAKAIATDLGMGGLLAELEELERSDPPGTSAARGAEFRREGDYWTLRYGSNLVRLRNAKGLAYLHQLVTNPGREFHVLDLVALAHGDASPRRAPSGDAGEVLDERARGAYRRRLEELAEELAEAEAFCDLERAARARAESEALVDQLAAAVGLGGRARVAASEAERARVAVTKAIKGTLARIAEVEPALGRHLKATVRTGAFCSYCPEAPVSFG